MKHGILVRGTLLGYRKSSFTDRDTGEIKERYAMGVSIAKPNEFGSTTDSLLKIRLNREDITPEFSKRASDLNLKDVEVYVDVTSWEMNGKTGLSLTYLPSFGINEFKG